MATAIGEGLLAGRLQKIPLLVDVDAHVVESPDLWSSRLPARYRDVGPRLVHAPAGEVALVDGKYVERPGTEGPDVAWWLYEETATQLKRYIAAAGVPADEVTMEGITYADTRPGCWQPAERLNDMDINGVQAQMCFPNYVRFCGQMFLWGQDKELSRLCVEAYNDWMVEEWCGSSRGRLIPLCLRPALGLRPGRGRGTPQRRPRSPCGGVHRASVLSRPAEPAFRLLGSVLR